MTIGNVATGSVADVVLAVGAIATGLWATYTYRQAKKAEVARWQKQIFDDLFLSGKFDAVRVALELDYSVKLGRLIELSVQERNEQLTDSDRRLLLELDNFLNLIEYVLYLEQDKNQIGASDREALLGYWTMLIGDPARSSLRYYASHYGYEKVTKLTGATSDTFLVLYGSLRSGQPKFQELGLDKALAFIETCQFRGDLYDLGEYPGAVPGKGSVRGEVYRVVDPNILAALDDYEEFDVARPDESLFVRRCIHVDGVGDAWVYLYNGSRENRRQVESGDWLDRQSAA